MQGIWSWYRRHGFTIAVMAFCLLMLIQTATPSPLATARARALRMVTFYSFLGLALASTAVGARDYALWHRTRGRVRTGLCPQCGYDLRASEVQCPECGGEIISRRSIRTEYPHP